MIKLLRPHLLSRFRAVIVPTVLFMVLPGCGNQTPAKTEMTQSSGDLQVSLIADPPIHSGDNDAVVIGIHEVNGGAPVNDAIVVATPNMTSPRLPGSPSSGRYHGDGQYVTPLRVVIASYSLAVHIERTGKPAVDVTFPLDVSK